MIHTLARLFNYTINKSRKKVKYFWFNAITCAITREINKILSRGIVSIKSKMIRNYCLAITKPSRFGEKIESFLTFFPFVIDLEMISYVTSPFPFSDAPNLDDSSPVNVSVGVES